MKITSLKQQIKNPERISVFVDGKFAFSLSLDELLKYRLKNEDKLSQADIKKFKKVSSDGKLRARALEWLVNRPHSTREFHTYLYNKRAEPEQIESLTAEMSGKGYLNDAKFARWFTELQSRRGKSNRAIIAELSKKGIKRELAVSSIDTDAGKEEERLKAVIAKKSQLSRYKNDPQKLMRYLIGQGFSWQMVKQVMDANSPKDA